MAARTRTGFQVVVWFAAANFAALVVLALGALATGAVSLDSIAAAARVLEGTSSAVPVDELAALRDARTKLEGRGDEAELMRGWTSFRDEKHAFKKRSNEERRTIKMLAAAAKEARKEIESAHEAFKADRAGDLRKDELEAMERRQKAFDKVKSVYRYMRPTEVARDLEARLASDRADEVAEIVRAMNDRTAAEVLEAIASPASRMRIYDALAGISGAADRP